MLYKWKSFYFLTALSSTPLEQTLNTPESKSSDVSSGLELLYWQQRGVNHEALLQMSVFCK